MIIKEYTDKDELIYIRLYKYEVNNEIFEDKNGILYAKELLTGLLFPLAIDVNSHTNYLYNNDGYNKQIKQIQDYEYDTMAKTKYVVVSNQIASKNMIDEYKNSDK